MKRSFYEYWFAIGGVFFVGLLLFSFIIPFFVITTPLFNSKTEEVQGSISMSAIWGGSESYIILDENGKSLGWGSKIIVHLTSSNSKGVQLFLIDKILSSNPGMKFSSANTAEIDKSYSINRRDTWYLKVGFGYWGYPENYQFGDFTFFGGTTILTTVSYSITYVINDSNEILYYLFLSSSFLMFLLIPSIIYLKSDKQIKKTFVMVQKDKISTYDNIIPSGIRCNECGNILYPSDKFCSNCGFDSSEELST